jgi:hypothetical protein
MSDWISVKDKLPERYKQVLVAYQLTTPSTKVGLALGAYQGRSENSDIWEIGINDTPIIGYNEYYNIVTHWKEIDIDYPESYKEFIKND